MPRKRRRIGALASAVVRTVLVLQVEADTEDEAQQIMATVKEVFGLLVAMIALVKEVLELVRSAGTLLTDWQVGLAEADKVMKSLWRTVPDLLAGKADMVPWIFAVG